MSLAVALWSVRNAQLDIFSPGGLSRQANKGHFAVQCGGPSKHPRIQVITLFFNSALDVERLVLL